MTNLPDHNDFDREGRRLDSEERREPYLGSDRRASVTTRDRYNSEPVPRRASGINGFLLGLLCAIVLGVPAFYFLSQRKPAEQPTTSSATTQPTSSPTAASGANPTATTEASTAQTGTTVGLPASQTLTLQVNHPNGSTARLNQVTFGEDSITADLALTNGYRSAIRLNSSHDMVITDNIGNQYNLAEPPNNEFISIDPGTTLKGQFVFKGRLAPSATSITLTTNNKYGGNQNYSTNPKMSFDVPLQGAAK